jgi:integrase
VLYTLNGKQTSVPYASKGEAEDFRDLVGRVGARRAMEIEDIPLPKSATEAKTDMTVEQWLTHHIDHLTGVGQATIDLYRMFVRCDIGPAIGDIPLPKLTEEDISRWVSAMATKVSTNTGRTPAVNSIKHKHAFLSGALAKAVPRHIPANPAAGRRLPKRTRDDDGSGSSNVHMLSRDEFARLLAAVTEPWRPLVEFLVASGCRWSEASGLKPEDVDRDAGTVRIARSWKHSRTSGYEVGPPKTRRSRRTINVDPSVLKKLNYDNEWLFTNRNGGPVRYYTFRARVWLPAVERSKLKPPPRIHHLRHTYASWMLNAGVPIPVVSRHLGHESIQVTVDIYGDIDRTVAAKAATVMAGILAAEPQKAIEAPRSGKPDD